MNTLPLNERNLSAIDRFNGPILDHAKLAEGTRVALLMAAASAALVLVTKLIYLVA